MVQWARENPGVAEVVESEADLSDAVNALAKNPDHCLALGSHALEIGGQYFSHTRVQPVFHQLLSV